MTTNAFDPGRRRCLAQLGGVLTLTALGPGFALTACSDGEAAATTTTNPAADGPFDVNFRLTAHPDTVAIKPGPASEVWRYAGERLAGPSDTLVSMEQGYLGPTIRLRRGQRVRAELHNGLSEDTTVHWHGLHVPPVVDGQPRHPIEPGETRTVAFDVADRAGLYWYHPHPHGPDGGRVGFQACAGLAGPLIIHDDIEDALDLPAGDQELLMVLQDRRLSTNNALEYLPHGMGAMMTRMHGFHGDELLVNGQPAGERTVSTRPYRLRLLNGSNARIYKLAFSDGRPVTVIGTDGGLLTQPVDYPFVTLAPAERLDVWVDFADSAVGEAVDLVSEAFSAGGMGGGMMGRMGDRGMMEGRGGMMGNNGMMDGMPMGGERFRVTRFRVTEAADSNQTLPERLAPDTGLPSVDESTPVRRFELGMRMMRGFTLNGRQMNGTNVADDEIVQLGTTEIWEFHNRTMMPHPMHVHGLQFGIVGREGAEPNHDLRAGLVDEGRHDTVLVLPGERVRIALAFEDFDGLYMYHCHNMEHEDNGMMRYYRVSP
jgi:FtsP/CotA-like multicopper oxidase with cupredoxin domain